MEIFSVHDAYTTKITKAGLILYENKTDMNLG